MSPLALLAALAEELSDDTPLEDLLQLVTERAVALTDARRGSIRLLDATRTKLIAAARSGEAPKQTGEVEFPLGRGLIGWIAETGRPLLLAEAEADPRFEAREELQYRLGAFVGVPLLVDRVCIGVLSVVHPNTGHFTEEALQAMIVLAALCSPRVENRRLARLARVDPLTGALNRRALSSLVPEDDQSMLSLIALDLDHFKRINDEHGHPAGDEVLRVLVDRLSSILRATDQVVRLGGEEFLLLLPGASLRQATRVAERARNVLQAQPVIVGGLRISITASFGVAQRLKGENREEVLARADRALMLAKAEGRNRVSIATNPTTT